MWPNLLLSPGIFGTGLHTTNRTLIANGVSSRRHFCGKPTYSGLLLSTQGSDGVFSASSLQLFNYLANVGWAGVKERTKHTTFGSALPQSHQTVLGSWGLLFLRLLRWAASGSGLWAALRRLLLRRASPRRRLLLRWAAPRLCGCCSGLLLCGSRLRVRGLGCTGLLLGGCCLGLDGLYCAAAAPPLSGLEVRAPPGSAEYQGVPAAGRGWGHSVAAGVSGGIRGAAGGVGSSGLGAGV